MRTLTVAVALVLMSNVCMATPPVFKDLGFDEAMARSKAEGRILVFDAMTSWCGPCKVMDRTTWVDPAVVKWIDEHAIAIQLDMDEHEALKPRTSIRAYPTVIIYRDGEEYDRVVGLRSPSQMMEWLGGVAAGETAAAQAANAHQAAKAAQLQATVRRAGLIDELVTYVHLDEATAETVWAWQAVGRDHPVLASWRRHSLPGQMGRLAQMHAPARDRYSALRVDAAAIMHARPDDVDAISNWADLNEVLRESRETVAWATRQADSEAGIERLRAMGNRLFPLLVSDGAWRAAGLTLQDPAAAIHEMGRNLGAYDIEAPKAPAGGMMPAIPMSIKGAAPVKAEAKSPPAMVPAVPMTARGAAPAKAMQEADAPKSVPMIPMTARGAAPATATQDSDAPKSLPMLPMTARGAEPADSSDADDRESVAREVRRRLTGQLRIRASEYHAACLAADRPADAAAVVEALFAYADDGYSRLWLARTALQADQVSAQVRTWIDQAAANGIDVGDTADRVHAAVGG